jgi:hypothetical protein
MDDAYHFLKERGLRGNHCTTNEGLNGVVNGRDLAKDSATTIVPGALSNGISQNHLGLSQSPHLLVWSAPDEPSLERVVLGYGPYYKLLVDHGRHDVERLAFTLGERRSRMPWRTFVVVGTPQELESPGLPETIKASRISEQPSLVFIFTGQGAQYVDMGMQLVRYRVFGEIIRQIDTIYKELGSQWSIYGTHFDTHSSDPIY